MSGGFSSWLPGIAVAAMVVSSCQLVVPEANLDDVRCQEEGRAGPPACPEGKTCFGGQCVVVLPGTDDAGEDVDASIDPPDGPGGAGGTGGSAGGTAGDGGSDASDAGAGGTGGPPTDAPEEETAKPLASLGEPCLVDQDCASQLCMDVPGTGTRACAKFCCNSFSCPAATVCASFWGDLLCVDPTLVQLDAVGPDPAAEGAGCSSGADCRSARCGSDGTCKDVCCIDGSCTNERACELSTQFGQAEWLCGTDKVADGLENGVDCTLDSDCSSNVCFDYTFGSGALVQCNGPCCKDSECASHGVQPFCDYAWDGARAIRQCFGYPVTPPDPQTACCNDSNCPPGKRCQPTWSNILNSYGTTTPDLYWVFRCR